MLQQITKSVIEESTTEQLYEMFDRLVEATSLRSFQGIGTDEALDETIARVAAEMNARGIGGAE